MTRDGEIPTIFNPRRNRTPSVLVTDENATPAGGGVGGIVGAGLVQGAVAATGTGTVGGAPGQSAGNAANGPFTHADSVGSSQQEGTSNIGEQLSPATATPSGLTAKYKSCSDSFCSDSARKIYFGIWVTVCVTASWVGATHCIKYLYIEKPVDYEVNITRPHEGNGVNVTALHGNYSANYKAPFFTTWFVTNWTMLFFPLYFISRLGSRRCESPADILSESVRDFRDKGFTAGRFLTRCSCFCVLWVGTNYMYIRSLHILLATDVMALFATNVSFVYLLSWVILHEQFVGIRIMAVIMCDTGVALLAYMDGITGSPTLGGVVLATSAAAGSAVYKVLFKKVIGDATYGQVALFFSLIGMLNAALLWPLSLALFLSGVETLHWERLPWPALLTASALSLVANLLGNFSVVLTYDLFITLGLITAVPVSAALDVVLYGAQFEGMKLAGMILIAVGFFLVMFPDNWPDYITRLLRRTSRVFMGKKYHHVESQCEMEQAEQAWCARSPSPGRGGLSHRLHQIPSAFALRQGQMTGSPPTARYYGGCATSGIALGGVGATAAVVHHGGDNGGGGGGAVGHGPLDAVASATGGDCHSLTTTPTYNYAARTRSPSRSSPSIIIDDTTFCLGGYNDLDIVYT